MIYCIGDSNTAGTELIDQEHFKDSYPGVFDKEYMDTFLYAEWWRIHAVKFYNTGTLKEKINRNNREKLKAWPAKLEKILNIPVINSAFMGASIESVVRNAITDILNSKIDIELIILQCPPAERVEVSYLNKIYSISTANDKHWIPDINNLLKILTTIETDYSLHRRYLFSLMQMHDFCKVKQIKLLLVPVNKFYLNFDKQLTYLKNHIDESMFPNTMTDEVEKISQKVYAPGGHFTEIIHESFAKSLAEYIKKQGLL